MRISDSTMTVSILPRQISDSYKHQWGRKFSHATVTSEMYLQSRKNICFTCTSTPYIYIKNISSYKYNIVIKMEKEHNNNNNNNKDDLLTSVSLSKVSTVILTQKSSVPLFGTMLKWSRVMSLSAWTVTVSPGDVSIMWSLKRVPSESK